MISKPLLQKFACGFALIYYFAPVTFIPGAVALLVKIVDRAMPIAAVRDKLFIRCDVITALLAGRRAVVAIRQAVGGKGSAAQTTKWADIITVSVEAVCKTAAKLST